MASTYECSECEHVQSVAVIDNGLSGFADPHAACGACGAEGSFHFVPGFKEERRQLIRSMADAVAKERSQP